MIRLLLSGEGSSDMGTASKPGPMALLVDQYIKKGLNNASIPLDEVQCLSESDLARRTKEIPKDRPQAMRLSGSKQPPGYATFQRLAQAMGIYAQDMEKTHNTPVIAILFRDSDGTRSERSEDPKRWENQYAAMKKGFSLANGYTLGVPMIPKPKSEAWLLCALKDPPYQHCARLEELPGNDASQKAPKKQLEAILGKKYDNDEMMDWIKEGQIEMARIQEMPSCTAFKKDLENALKQATT